VRAVQDLEDVEALWLILGDFFAPVAVREHTPHEEEAERM